MTIGTINRKMIRTKKHIPAVTTPVTLELDDVMLEHLDEKDVFQKLISILDDDPDFLRLQPFQTLEPSIRDLHKTMTAQNQEKEHNS